MENAHTDDRTSLVYYQLKKVGD